MEKKENESKCKTGVETEDVDEGSNLHNNNLGQVGTKDESSNCHSNELGQAEPETEKVSDKEFVNGHTFKI